MQVGTAMQISVTSIRNFQGKTFLFYDAPIGNTYHVSNFSSEDAFVSLDALLADVKEKAIHLNK